MILQSSRGAWAKVKGFANKILNRNSDTPRQLQERNELYIAILAATHRQLRFDSAQKRKHSLRKYTGNIGTTTETRDEIKALIAEATEKLMNEKMLYDMTVTGLRLEFQSLLAPQVVQMLQACRSADEIVSNPGKDTAQSCKEILSDEYSLLGRTLDECSMTNTKIQNRQIPYLTKKKGAMETIMKFYSWSEQNEAHFSEEEGDSSCTIPDDFGYSATKYASKEATNQAIIRHHQMMNLSKAVLIRKKLDYSVVALQSTIPNSGRGAYVDGTAMAGTLLAFFPGEVWPKQHLTTTIESVFDDDPDHQLSIRYDDILIDARNSPRTLLSGDYSNALAIAHIANHPPTKVSNNCQTVMIDFTEHMMNLDNNNNNSLLKYIPNTYARQPMSFGPKSFDRNEIVMHGFGLLASRDVCNEELFYDYRLSPGNSSYPDWYCVFDEEELRNRWWQH